MNFNYRNDRSVKYNSDAARGNRRVPYDGEAGGGNRRVPYDGEASGGNRRVPYDGEASGGNRRVPYDSEASRGNRRIPNDGSSYHSYNNKHNPNDTSNNQETVSLETRQTLLKYMYHTIELSNYKYKLIEYEYDLPLLKEKQYYVSPNYNGIHSLLIFIKIKDQYLSFVIDRKTLTYNINQIDYDKVKIIPVHYRFDEEIYSGSIFDGVLLYNNIDGIKHFVINDIYCLRGKNMSGDKVTNKMLNISTYLETQIISYLSSINFMN